MQEFLTFKTFITPTLLIVFYYMGAILIPLLSYMVSRWLLSKYLQDVTNKAKAYLTSKQRITLLLLSVFFFLGMEIFWRMMFEFFIAYFDMHDALMRLS